MNDYWISYGARMERNHNTIMEIKKRIEAFGGTVELGYTNAKFKSFLRVKSDGRCTCFGFAEVPYRWYIGNEYNGSVVNDTENPFSAEQIIAYCKKYGTEAKDA